jgi:hypothetical protein
METTNLPASLPNPERLSAMLSAVGTSFQSVDAYEAAREAGFDVSERTLRNDLNDAADAGLLERTGSGAWRKVDADSSGDRSEIRTRVALALLSAGEWHRDVRADGVTYSFGGPSPEELARTVDRYAAAIDALRRPESEDEGHFMDR